MKIKAVCMAVLTILVTAPSASADLLCIKKSQRIKGAKVSLASVLQTATSTCPAGYVPVLDTDLFQGPQGPKGADGRVNWSSCYSKMSTKQSSSYGWAAIELRCNDTTKHFMLSDSYSYSPSAALPYLDMRFAFLEKSTHIPVGVLVSTGNLNSASYQLSVAITCCSR